jgi:diacylglycerol O-acyltransferase / wax synthase
MRMLQFQKHFVDWLRDRLPDDGFYTFPAMAARLTPGDLGNQMRELLNRRQRAAGQTDIVPYIPTMSPPRTAFTGQISANRQFVFAEMSFARVRAISKKAATTMNNVVMTICAGALRPYLINHGGIPDQPLTVCCPVSLRRGDLTDRGNHVHTLFAELPTNVDDPLERLRLTTDNLTRAKASFDAMPTELLREATEFLPRDMFDWFVDAVVRLPEDRLQVPWNVILSNIRARRSRCMSTGSRSRACVASILPSAGRRDQHHAAEPRR